MKKKIDPKIQTLLDNCSKTNQRAFLLIVGDRGKDQVYSFILHLNLLIEIKVVNFHYLLSKNSNILKPKVLWCYKKELGFSSNKKKRMREIQKLQKKGLYNANIDEPFELFTSSNEIRYCFYKETEKILGNTFSLLVLQDFESVTPNILCRTIETIEGGFLFFDDLFIILKKNRWFGHFIDKNNEFLEAIIHSCDGCSSKISNRCPSRR